MKTSIVILTYNQLSVTKQCIESIFKNTNINDIELIIVDNGSTDGTVEYLKNQNNITTIFNVVNLGFAAGCNQGLKISTGDAVLFLNNDTVVTKNWLQPMINLLFSNEKIGMVGCVSNYVSGAQQVPVSYNDLSGLEDFAVKYCEEHAGEHKQVFRLVGFCLMIKKSLLDEIGGFDERFKYGSFEDDDLCLRALLQGYSLHIAYDSFIHHIGHSTFKANDDIDINALYRENYQRFIHKWNTNIAYYTHPRYDIVRLVPETDRIILDVGCGFGATGLELMNRQNCEIYGIEQYSLAATVAENIYSKINKLDMDQCDLPYEENYFDSIILADVLEHLKDPWKIINNCYKVLKPGGKLICSIPNVLHGEALLPLLMGYWNYVPAGILDKTHLRFFTPLTVHTLFPGDKFRVVHHSNNNIPVDENAQKLINEIAESAQKYGYNFNLLAEYCNIYQMLLVVQKIVS